MNVVGDEEWSQPMWVLGTDKTSSDILDESSEWSAAVVTASGFVLRGDQKVLVLRFSEAVGPVSVDPDEIERSQSSPNGEAVYLRI